MLDTSAYLCLGYQHIRTVVKMGFDPQIPMLGSCSSFKITVQIKKKKNKTTKYKIGSAVWKQTGKTQNIRGIEFFKTKYDFSYTCSFPPSLCSPLSLRNICYSGRLDNAQLLVVPFAIFHRRCARQMKPFQSCSLGG